MAPRESHLANSTTGSDVDAYVDSRAVAERYRPSIYRYVLRLVGDARLADDLTQDTFLRVHQHLGALKDAAALEAWLYRIATHVCYDRFRQHEHRRPALPVVAQVEAGTDAVAENDPLRPDQLVERQEMSECVLAFLDALPPAQRQVLVLHDVQGYTNPEIADMLSLSLHNVKMRLHRARARLRAAMEGCDFSGDDRGVFVCEPRYADSGVSFQPPVPSFPTEQR